MQEVCVCRHVLVSVFYAGICKLLCYAIPVLCVVTTQSRSCVLYCKVKLCRFVLCCVVEHLQILYYFLCILQTHKIIFCRICAVVCVYVYKLCKCVC